MPRRKFRKKNFNNHDYLHDSVLIQKITNQLTKCGKRALAQNLINKTIQEIETKTQQDPIQVIERAVYNAAPAVEIRARRIGGAIYSIPTELSNERSISIAIRWLISYCSTRSGKELALKLANEMIDASNKVGLTIRKRDEVHRIAASSAKLK